MWTNSNNETFKLNLARLPASTYLLNDDMKIKMFIHTQHLKKI